MHYDLVIIGNGLIGASLAYALKTTSRRIALIEAHPAGTTTPQSLLNTRALALSYGSASLYQQWGLWSRLSPWANPILKVHVSERGQWGQAKITAQQQQVPALGYVIEAQALQQQLQQALADIPQLTIFCPAKVKHLQHFKAAWQLELATAEQTYPITADCVIATDGSQSSIRQLLGLTPEQHDYGKTALIATVRCQQPQTGIAFERFTASGPLAFLPMANNCYGVVWSVSHAAAQTYLDYDDEAFLKQLQHTFGYRLGRLLEVGKRQHYPLQSLYLKHQTLANLVLLGNCAHTLHPVAGQGLNLGLRDTACLVALLQQALSLPELLTRYQQLRQADQTHVIRLTHRLVDIFSNDHWGLKLGRNIGLLAIDKLPYLKGLLARKLMGLT